MNKKKQETRQYDVRMRVTRIELWTVEATSEEEAIRKAEACQTVDELDQEMTDWESTGIYKGK